MLFSGMFCLVYAFGMLGNAICILNRDRFLANLQIKKDSRRPFLRHTSDLYETIRTLCRIPLIFLNIVLILYELLFG